MLISLLKFFPHHIYLSHTSKLSYPKYKKDKQFLVQVVLPEESQEVKSLLCILGYYLCVGAQRQVLLNLDTQELEVRDPLHMSRGRMSVLFHLKSTVRSFVFGVVCPKINSRDRWSDWPTCGSGLV